MIFKGGLLRINRLKICPTELFITFLLGYYTWKPNRFPTG